MPMCLVGQDVNWQRVSAISSMQGKALITLLRDAKEKVCYVRAKDDPTTQEDSRTVQMEILGTREGLELQAECWLCPEANSICFCHSWFLSRYRSEGSV